MTTDRTAAPPRSTALHERSPAAAGQKAAPADAFSALLGAVAPRTEEAPRKPQERRDDSAAKRDEAQCDAPVAPAPVAEAPAPEAPVEPETPVLPSLFALQLASPLPPAATCRCRCRPRSRRRRRRRCPRSRPAQIQSPITAVPATGEPVAVPASELPSRARRSGAAAARARRPDPGVGACARGRRRDRAGRRPGAAAAAVPTAPAADATPEQVAIPNANAGQTQSDAQPQEQPNTAAPAPAAAPQQAKPAEAPAAVTAPAPQPVAAPAAPAAPATPTPTLERAVPLYRAVETTGMLLHVAAERGVTHARLNLKPVELGGIEVRLQSTPQGVSAQLVADSPEAARMLTQASDDLRRQLAERDVTLLSLDVSTSSEQRHENTAGGFGAFGDDNYRPGFGSSQRNGVSDAETVDAAPAAAETTLVLPDGVLVDVLA